MEEKQVEMLMEHGIDYVDGVERFGDNAPMFERFIIRFLDDKYFDQLEGAIEDNDVEEAFQVAHTLKGVVGNLSFKRYFKTVDVVTEALRANDIDKAKEKMGDVKDSHKDVMKALQQL